MNRAYLLKQLFLGQAVGDAIGLPMEGLGPAMIDKLGWTRPLKHRMLGRFGLISDDTEHLMMTAEALLRSEGDVKKFTSSLAWRLRWWLLGLPCGVGKATALAIGKLWLGWSPGKSGVFSAGNGPAMRATVIGCYFHDDGERRQSYTESSTIISHSDPKALTGALMIAELAARLTAQEADHERLVERLGEMNIDSEIKHRLAAVMSCLAGNLSESEMWVELGCQRGVSGYIYHTVPAVLYCGLKYDWNYREAVTHAVALGGDTDTTAAILGALCGVAKPDSIPQEWLNGLRDYPRSKSAMQSLAERCVTGKRRMDILFPIKVLLRNLLFFLLILFHLLIRGLHFFRYSVRWGQSR